MKRLILMLIAISALCRSVCAESEILAYTQQTDVICTVDGLFAESYAIDGFIYLPLDSLVDYGFNVTETSRGIAVDRSDIIYFDGCYEEKQNKGGFPVYENDTPVLICGQTANTYATDGRIVIQADELSVFGKVLWNEEMKTVEISIAAEELKNAFKTADDKEYFENCSVHITGQKRDGEWNGIVETSYYQGMTYLGYMINGEYEGVVYGYRMHTPYLASLFELKTVRNGLKNGYCRYKTGYNNKPEPPGTIKSASGIYENDRLKNGEYTIYIDYAPNTITFEVADFNEQKIYSNREYYEFAECDSQIFYNGELLCFDTAPVIEDDRTLIPLRGFFEKTGASAEWDDASKTAVITVGETVISVSPDRYGIKINGNYKYADVPPRLINGRIMIPLRFLAEELGYTVAWGESGINITDAE